MLLSLVTSFLLLRRFKGKAYVLLTVIALFLFSLFSVGVPYVREYEAGYHYPDFGGLAFIGFRNGAPPLIRTIDGKVNASFYFIDKFYFWLAALPPRTINGALDKASLWIWGVSLDECQLYTNPNFQMRVYGDGFFTIEI